ncbi:MAG: DNA-protecting protein DprA, partial [Lachnospiraceae bacterium]|nr:DNA-protecting protein DprA [Lachnospiraceae bacterium]
GYAPKPFDFQRRNRLIAGLSDVLLVIEAAERSGSFITANLALEQNKEVFALPGRVTDPISRGCNLLIRSGAEILTCPEDVLQYLGIKVRHDRHPKPSFTLSKEENAVFQMLTPEERTVEELMEKSGYPVSELLPVLVRLEILGAVKKGPSGGYIRA